jgi:hypothetical protein
MICANWPSGSGEEVKNVKFYRQTDGQTDDGQKAFSSGELKKLIFG